MTPNTGTYDAEVGIKGNTHFPFSDLNNVAIANLMEAWLQEKGLSKQCKEAKKSMQVHTLSYVTN